jgi:hypothetical protein
VFENRLLRRIFGPKRDEEISGWKKLHNGQLHNLYSFAKYNSNDEAKDDEIARYVARMGRSVIDTSFRCDIPKEKDH